MKLKDDKDVIVIQILAETEYQDLYRVTDGVLFVVNKFVPMFEKRSPVDYSGRRSVKYHKNTKDLTINQKDVTDWHKNFIPKGTILYNYYPVISTDNQSDWIYQIKTTGDSFSGNADEMENMLSDILYRIKEGK